MVTWTGLPMRYFIEGTANPNLFLSVRDSGTFDDFEPNGCESVGCLIFGLDVA